MKVFILGTSPAGATAAEEIRRQDSDAEILLWSFDGQYPRDPESAVSLLKQEKTIQHVLFKPPKFYEEERIQVILDKKLSRINFNRRKIFTEEKETFDYDVLIISDLPEQRFPEVKGTHRAGVFGLTRFNDIQGICDAVSLIDTVTVCSETFCGFEAAAALAKRDKEVLWLCSQANVLRRMLGEEVFAWLAEQLAPKGLRIILDNPLEEILGDAETRAVRLKSGKVLASELVLFTETRPDWRILKDTPLELREKICVDENFRTNIENVFAVDTVCEACRDGQRPPSDIPWSEQGRIVAAAIQGIGFVPAACPVTPCPIRTIPWDDLTVTCLGTMDGRETARQIERFERDRSSYQKLFGDEQTLSGAILLNAEQRKAQWKEWIEQRVHMDWDAGLLDNGTEEGVLEDKRRAAARS